MPVLTAPLEEARENLRVIRQTMERSTKYSTLSGLSGVLIGLAAIAGVLVSHALLARAGAAHPLAREDYLPLGPVWLLVLALAVGIEFACNKRRAAHIGKRVGSPLGAHILVAALPSFFAAALLTLFFYLHDLPSFVWAVWMLCYGLAICAVGLFSIRPVSLPRRGLRPGRGGDTAAAGPRPPAHDGPRLRRLSHPVRRPDGAEARMVNAMAVIQAGTTVQAGYAAVVESLEAIDETIHQKVRLGIMSALMARGETDFRFLKETLSVTDGNLSIHLSKLEEAGYVVSAKEFVRKKPHTTYAPTDAGRAAFHAYLGALERIVQSAGQGPREG